jgi:hypothetical protein
MQSVTEINQDSLHVQVKGKKKVDMSIIYCYKVMFRSTRFVLNKDTYVFPRTTQVSIYLKKKTQKKSATRILLLQRCCPIPISQSV